MTLLAQLVLQIDSARMYNTWLVTLVMAATLPSGLTKIFEKITDDGDNDIIKASEDAVTVPYVLNVDENKFTKDSFSNYKELRYNNTESSTNHTFKNQLEMSKNIMAKTGSTLEYQIEKYKVEEEEKLGFTFQPSYFPSEVEEFVFSPWYFLVFSTVNKSSSLPATISLISSEILESLSSKLSVPSSVFFITSIVKYTTSDTFLSVNMSLVTPLIPNLHQELCTLHKKTPFFMIGGTMVELYQVKHQYNQHIYVTRNKVGCGENICIVNHIIMIRRSRKLSSNTGCPAKHIPLLFFEFLSFLLVQKFHLGHFSNALSV